jgi:hypothetical protein
MIYLTLFALYLILFAALTIWTNRSGYVTPPFLKVMAAALFMGFVASSAFAADMIPAHQPLDPGTVSVVDLLSGFGVPISAVHIILTSLVILYVAITELLPFFPGIKANGLLHFLALAFSAMKVDPKGQSVLIDKAQLKEAVVEAFPMLASPKPLKQAMAEEFPSIAVPKPPARDVEIAAAATPQAPAKEDDPAPDSAQSEAAAQPTDAEIEAAKATLAAAGIQVAAPAGT